jgi:outer membrane murein-binding lipoprotein Lpp
MQSTMQRTWLVVGGLTMLAGCASTQPTQPNPKEMTFFLTSVGPGKGGDLGGLEGADQHCQSLAKAAGAGNRTWRAYLSTQGSDLRDPKFVNARERIGSGPWQNAKGAVIARNVQELHSANNNLTKQTSLDERGQLVNGRTEKPNKHDILTGSRPDGTAFPGKPFPDMTCSNWTNGGNDGSAMTGHHDRAGPIEASWAVSWNSAHPTLGCSQERVRPTGGDGLFYCFAVK